MTAGPAPDSRRPNVIGGPGCDFIAARIERLLRRPGPGKSIGEGPVFCRPARLCCRSRFTSPQQLVSYAGLNPRVRQSGLGVAQHGAPGLSAGGFA